MRFEYQKADKLGSKTEFNSKEDIYSTNEQFALEKMSTDPKKETNKQKICFHFDQNAREICFQQKKI